MVLVNSQYMCLDYIYVSCMYTSIIVMHYKCVHDVNFLIKFIITIFQCMYQQKQGIVRMSNYNV